MKWMLFSFRPNLKKSELNFLACEQKNPRQQTTTTKTTWLMPMKMFGTVWQQGMNYEFKSKNERIQTISAAASDKRKETENIGVINTARRNDY